MKHLLLAALLLSAASCASDDDTLKYQKVRVEVPRPDVNIEPDGKDLQYMAYCHEEERALSGWMNSRSEAESKARDYTSEHPDRKYSILWRQKPGARMVPRF